MTRDGGGDSGLLGAGGEPVRGVFDVAAGDDVVVVEEEGDADAEVAVWGIGVMGDGEGTLAEVFDLSRRDAGWSFVLRHRVEAIECALAWQGFTS